MSADQRVKKNTARINSKINPLKGSLQSGINHVRQNAGSIVSGEQS